MRQFLHFLPATIWFVIICGLYSMHQSNFPRNNFWDFISLDKMIHLFLFAYWTHLLLVAFHKQTKWNSLRDKAFTIALIMSLSIGVVFELMQGMIFASRHTELLDLLANATGSLIGMALFKLVYGDSVARE